MTSPLHMRVVDPFLGLLHDLSLQLNDYTSFLQSHSTQILTSKQQLQESAEQHQDSNQATVAKAIMSNQQSIFQSHSYSSSSFTSSRNGEGPQIWSSTESRSSNPQGTTIHRTSEQPGQLPTQETLRFDESGKVIGQPRETGRIEDVSDADKEYLERMEEEYAKREGGA